MVFHPDLKDKYVFSGRESYITSISNNILIGNSIYDSNGKIVDNIELKKQLPYNTLH